MAEMDMKEKLVELLYDTMFFEGYGRELCEQQADYLIANGVTVQDFKGVEIDQFRKWIPVSERLPEEDTRVLVWVRERVHEDPLTDTDRLHWGCWVRWGINVTHWMPLPQPPKGE